MGNLPKLHEHTLFQLQVIYRSSLALAMRDQALCEEERAHLSLIRSTQEHAKRVHALKEISDYLEKGGDPCTAYGRRLANAAQLGITHIDDYREQGNVVPLYGDGPETA